MAFKKQCAAPGCGALTSSKYCEVHAKMADEDKARYDQFRGSSARRGYDSRWRKYRIAFLDSHPLCEECAKHDRMVLATVVDHIIPHKGDMKLFWDSSNHQALCESCHNRKTAKEDMGAWDYKSGLK